ncbi:MAG: hypothetical protein ACOYK6_02415 [Chthoniobacterales bacterium]
MKRLNSLTTLIFGLITFLASFLPVELRAQAVTVPKHVGTQNLYKIGTQEHPVYALEYNIFLNKQAAYDDEISEYFDRTFMTAENPYLKDGQIKPGIVASIYRLGFAPNYTYAVINGHECDIIDGVYSNKIQKEFNAWREGPEWTKNPTLAEDCRYIWSLIRTGSHDSEDAKNLRDKYPQAQDLFHNFDTACCPAKYYTTGPDSDYLSYADCFASCDVNAQVWTKRILILPAITKNSEGDNEPRPKDQITSIEPVSGQQELRFGSELDLDTNHFSDQQFSNRTSEAYKPSDLAIGRTPAK